jgi:membrane fusion protein (multidrug efflux system)
MSKRYVIVILALVLIFGTIFGVKFWLNIKSAGMPRMFPPTVVASAEVKEENWKPSLKSVGSLVATNGISVSTEVNGIVSGIVFQSGQAVQQGQVLLHLDDKVDQAALAALRADQRLSEIQFNRVKDLLKKHVTSKADYDEAQAKFDAAKARVKGQIAVINRKTIRAPFSGLLGIREVDLGQYLEAGKPIVKLEALDPIFVDYTLPERFLNQLKVGQTVKVKLDALPGQEFNGQVSAVDSGVSTGTRTLKVRASLSNDKLAMRPGMFAEVRTIVADAHKVLTVPYTAISFNTYGNFVYVINKTDKGEIVKRQQVATGEVREGRVAIVQGLSAGRQVVRAGLVKLRDGIPVKIDNSVELNDAEVKTE